MDGHGRSTTASVVELRLRLYRPEPPVGAVADYLAALRAAPVPVPPPRTAPRASSGRRSRLLSVLLAGACALGAGGGAILIGRQVPHAVPAVPGHVAAAPAAGRLEAPPVTGVPLGDLFGSGPGSGTFQANRHRAVASVLCTGTGTLELRLGPEPPTVLTCDTAAPALALIASTTRLDRFTVRVVPSGTVRWSLSAGALVD